MTPQTPSTAWTPLSGPSRQIALAVLLDGPLSRGELSRRVGLSAGSLSRLTKPLLDSGLLVEASAPTDVQPDLVGEDADPGRPRLGRPALPLDVAAASRLFIGVKLTGDRAYAALTDLRAKVLSSDEAPLPDHAAGSVSDVGTVVEVVADLVDRLVAALSRRHPAAEVTGLGVSIGGHVEGRSSVTHADFLGWEGTPLAQLLTDRTGLPTVVENDLVAVTEATHWFGEGHGSDRFALFTTGAGIGYGLVVGGSIVTSPDAGFSLLSHVPLDPTGPLGPCGHTGCATAMLTITALVSEGSRALGRTVTYDQLLDLAAAGDPAARAVVDRAGLAMGRMLALIANLTLPERIVLGGEGIRLAEVAASAVTEGLRRDRDPRAQDPEIIPQSPDLALWARGAAVAAIQAFVLGH